MKEDIRGKKIEYLKGVGPLRAEVLKKELGIFTCGDLLKYYPFRYVDRTKFNKVSEVKEEGNYYQLKGTIVRITTMGERGKKRFVAMFSDGSGTLELVWFQGIKWIAEKIRSNTEYIVFGKPNFFAGKMSMVHPELNETSEVEQNAPGVFQPVYHSGEKLSMKGLDSKGIMRLTRVLVKSIEGSIPESLPDDMRNRFNLKGFESSLMNVHFPTDEASLQKAIFRLKFDEFFFGQLRLRRLKMIREAKQKGFPFLTVGEQFNDFYKNHLPFPLTGAQKKVLKEIRVDMGSGKQMNRLLQGDVGSGKTVVALMSMLIGIDNGFQACMMAPTEILANQHLETLKELLSGMKINVGLITGSTKASQRKKITESLGDGTMHIILGTHALLEDDVQFMKLGVVVIDEQHKFGVEQRSRLWNRNETSPPHILVMTATPIPRTLAMTFYGDLEVSVIDELPPGRKPVSTVHRFESQRLKIWGFLKEQIKEGRQIYIVYPLIEESQKLDLNNLYAGYEAVCRDFPAPEFRIGIVHGQMKPADKDFEMRRFLKKETQILVATTVIEVGVNIANASVMVIENAERFGLSQLHQLRGRVGRGADKSYCILITSGKLSQEAKVRLDTMCRTNDGFEIAETDLKLRGPGDIMGTQQSGETGLRLADLAHDEQILLLARDAAKEILEKDMTLEKPEHKALREHYITLFKDKPDWGRVS